MVAFGHTAIGAVSGIICYKYLDGTNLPLGLAITSISGVTLHYLTDLIPHGHFFRDKYKSKIIYVIIFDLFLSIAIFLGLSFFKFGFNPPFWYVLFGIGSNHLPDVLDGLINTGFLPKKGFMKKEQAFHQWIHWHGILEKTLMFNGRDIWQILVFIISLVILIKY